jgi:lipoyl synthase
MGTAPKIARKPEWLRIQLNTNRNYNNLKKLFQNERVHTVCEEAKCPNIHECWGTHKTASFMILGDTCTRRCRFCAVQTGMPAGKVDVLEPLRVAESVRGMGLFHVVVTMVNRDDLPNGGAEILAATVSNIHRINPECTVEVLSSDLMGKEESIEILVKSRPEVIGHNIETVKRLTPAVRSRSSYERSLAFLKKAKDLDPDSVTKSSMMLGLGETKEEILEAMDDLLENGVTLMNLGQYLQPTKTHLPVLKYWTPEEFRDLESIAREKGFVHCESGPLVRSSYHAGEQYQIYRRNTAPVLEGMSS